MRTGAERERQEGGKCAGGGGERFGFVKAERAVIGRNKDIADSKVS